MTKQVKNVLFVQVNPCVRNIKEAAALKQAGLKVHLAYAGKPPQKTYGFGHDFYASIHNLGDWTWLQTRRVRQLVKELDAHLVHYHNFPDELGARLIRARLPVPVVYDQHDFFSQKKQLSARKLKFERICLEEADAAVHITEKYRQLGRDLYRLTDNFIVLPNYALGSLAVEPPAIKEEKPIHLVYIGLITEHADKVRNLISYFQVLSDAGFIIHIYPTRSKAYPQYSRIPNVVLHRQLPLDKLVQEISRYHWGILFLNKDVSEQYRIAELKHGAWNKFFDYITAGLPVITFDTFSYMARIVEQENFGVVVNQVQQITPEMLTAVDRRAIQQQVLRNRERYFMEGHIQPLIELYHKTVNQFSRNYGT